VTTTESVIADRALQAGEAAPWFRGRTLGGHPNFEFSTVGGHHVMLMFMASAGNAEGQGALRAMLANRDLFDDRNAMIFGVTRDPDDEAKGRIAHILPGIRWFLDYDGAIARQFGVLQEAGDRPFWLLLDPQLRVVARAGAEAGDRILAVLRARTALPREDGHAPVLIVPRIFEPEFCRYLIEVYDRAGGQPSGFMRDVGGKTVGMLDDKMKRRSDHFINDEAVRAEIRIRLARRLVPMMQRAFSFNATRIERYMVACYGSEGAGGYFRAHRDNVSAGTAHRRFACTINLNEEEYEGGDLTFPEYGVRRYRAPTGGAVIFACGMLHEAQPVTRGKRYACLPFFYDEAAARQREAIVKSGKVNEDLASYRA